jgi:hypothetical protein
MENSANSQTHSTGDEVLSLLSSIPGTLGSFVRAYPGRQSGDESWLDSWFLTHINGYFNLTITPDDKILVHKTLPNVVQGNQPAEPIRLKSVVPHYFRGFRDVQEPINLDGNLVVIEGRNSSGKTSLAEALEWLFTGRLSRRENKELGSPRELENCISNEFRPENENTWVKATFVLTKEDINETFTLCRLLKSDYGASSESKCFSVLTKNDIELSANEEQEELDRLFASEPPLLMQHTLRDFVQSNPRDRRTYFERLLKLDEITDLISKAVIGSPHLKEFLSPSGSKALKNLTILEEIVEKSPSKKACSQLCQNKDGDIIDRIKAAFSLIASQEFSSLITESTEFENIRIFLQQEQEKAKQRSFPLLEKLRPKRIILEGQVQVDHTIEAADIGEKIKEAWKVYEPAKKAAQSIGKERIVVSQVLGVLIEKELLQRDVLSQRCPLCDYKLVETLTAERISEIRGWAPIQENELSARKSLQDTFNMLIKLIQVILREYDEFLPKIPTAAEWEIALKEASGELKQAVQLLRKIREVENIPLEATVLSTKELINKLQSIPDDSNRCEEEVTNQSIETIKKLEDIQSTARKYLDAFLKVEAATSAVARVDPKYRLRENWMICSDGCTALAEDLRWEYAKRAAQTDLETIRDALMEYRKHFLEIKRTSFNDGIGAVWGALRADEYSSFSELHIPEPRGKGFPIEIEVKAVLNDGEQKKEVDALRVFSESQVNALGIAAFVTRSKLLGHKMLIFDDPVQSMDEEHFKTFAKDVITHVLEEGFQVVLLTHNDTFARDVSYYHQDRPEPEYVTMKTVLNKRKGCIVEEGNRRVFERLKRAEKEIENGDTEKAWALIRRSIERLYIIAYQKYGPSTFNPHSWEDQTAESMWLSGIGTLIEGKIPGSGKELKDIINKTVAGSHDKSPRGETDIRNSIKYLKNLVGQLQLGG